MLKFRKFWIALLGVIIILWFNFQYTEWKLWNWLPRDHNETQWSLWKNRLSEWKIDNSYISKDDPIWSWSKVIWDKSNWILHLPHKADYKSELSYALALIQIAVNRTLGMLSAVALAFILYNWFLILTSGSDDKNASKWRKWISTAAIALAWIALSWLIISFMIRFITYITSLNIV